MKLDRLNAFIGNKIILEGEIGLYSPTIQQIGKLGEFNYRIYLVLISFNKRLIFQDLLSMPEKEYEAIANRNDYEFIVSVREMANEIAKALSFFSGENVRFDPSNQTFMIDDFVFVDKNNYLNIAKTINELNGVSEEEDTSKPKLKNDRAKKMFEKIMKHRKKSSSENNLDLKDILSILCSAEGNGINIFNVNQLTIYQVYERFERLNIIEGHKRMLKVWANGLLDKDTKVPEWVIKSKL